MIHLFEIDWGGQPFYWEAYNSKYEFICTLENKNELDLYLDIVREIGYDFVLHTLKEYDEYHLALSS